MQMPDEDALRALIRKGTIGNHFVPVLCGSAFKNKGVQPLLDAVNAYLPSPLDVPPMKASSSPLPSNVKGAAGRWKSIWQLGNALLCLLA